MKLSITIASRPLIITLRHIFVAAGDAELAARHLGREAELVQRRQQLLRVRPTEQQRHLDAMRRHRGHHRAFDIAPAGRRRLARRPPIFAPGDAELKSRKKLPGVQRRRARLGRGTVWLAVTARDRSAPPRARRPRATRPASRCATARARASAPPPPCAVSGRRRVDPWPRARRSSARMRPTSP